MSAVQTKKTREERIMRLVKHGEDLIEQVRSYPTTGLRDRLKEKAEIEFYVSRRQAEDLAETAFKILKNNYPREAAPKK